MLPFCAWRPDRGYLTELHNLMTTYTTISEVYGMETSQEWINDKVDGYVAADGYDPTLYAARGCASAVPGPLSALTVADRDRYRREGYLAVTDVISPAVVGSAVDGIDALISGSAPAFRGIQWEAAVRDRLPTMSLDERRASVRKLVYYVEHEPRLFKIAHDPMILNLARDLLGSEPELFADQALLKPPGIGREKPWHQDKAFFDIRPGAPVVGLWIALDATDADNGCMHVIPGSHVVGPIVHFNRRDFQICDSDVRRTEVLSVPLPPGGCLIFDGLLQHGTPMNVSQRRRWALQLHYAPAEAIWRSPEERAEYKNKRLALFGADGKDATC